MFVEVVGFLFFPPCGYMLIGIWQGAIKNQLENHKTECGESETSPTTPEFTCGQGDLWE